MVLLFLCIVINAFIGVIFKFFQKYEVESFQAIVINYWVCVLTGSLLIGEVPIGLHMAEQPWFPYALALSVTFIGTFTMMAKTVQQFGIVTATIFQKMSLIAPTLIGILLYSEGASIVKVGGILLAIFSIFVITKTKAAQGNTAHEPAATAKNWIFPIIVLVGSCFIDSLLYYVNQHNLVSGGDIRFVIGLFFFAAVTGSCVLGYQLLASKTRLTMKSVYAGIGLGVPNLFSIYLLVHVLADGLPGSVVFPINNVGILAMSAVFGLLIFRERLGVYKISGLTMAIAAIILIANG